jgi:Flp pilus assembly protein TadG
MVEFALAGIPVIFVLFSTVQLGMAMWSYHTLAYAVRQGARLATFHGKGCTTNGNACTITVGAITTEISNNAPGIVPSQFNVTLTTASGATTTCNPVSTCLSSSTVWPPAANNDNAPGATVTISAMYVFPAALSMFWPGAGSGVSFGTIALPASTQQIIVF